MPFNGSGVFNRIYSWVTDAANGIDVSSSRTDTDTNDIASGLSNCITKDGQQTVTANIPMSGFKITGLGTGTSPSDAAAVQNANFLNTVEFRLTLTTAVPVTTSDVTAATTIYFSPYKGSRIALYDGTNWNMRSSAEISIAVPASTSQMYDIFCYDNAGAPTLELLAWTNDTTRATALVTQNGVLSKTGALTRRYVGSFRTTTVSGQTADAAITRFLWNYYNRVQRMINQYEATGSWSYTTATWRQARASAANQVDFVIGVAEDVITSQLVAYGSNTNTGVNIYVGLGYDSVSTPTSTSTNQMPRLGYGTTAVANGLIEFVSTLNIQPAIGHHYIAWLEYSTATGTTTFHGSDQLTGFWAGGITGFIQG
jgi:hypothetical protein